MTQRRHRTRLLLEAGTARGIFGEVFRQDLDGDVAVQAVVAGR
jgi:hypothetical protein